MDHYSFQYESYTAGTVVGVAVCLSVVPSALSLREAAHLVLLPLMLLLNEHRAGPDALKVRRQFHARAKRAPVTHSPLHHMTVPAPHCVYHCGFCPGAPILPGPDKNIQVASMRCPRARALIPRAAPLQSGPFQDVQVSPLSCLCGDLFVPFVPLRAQPHQDVHAAVPGSIRARGLVEWATLLGDPLQYMQVTIPGSSRRGSGVPTTPSLPHPSQQPKVPRLCSSSAGAAIPRAPLL
mmetsp:Transcript_7081/g.12854  ORF Transcript_7081/g.12854 Transcript_7081/m.12854 type:complete len:237 (-) Transcript_7081:6-716(-)